ncbi:hypothetical protein PG994_009334 [Apiospora phragmitis]|uniref:Uncharacterized protein n=1 Tax=Apiospora phragmitis TaxID=2905665 RepID=A0ABR1UIZ6_9PEZI
MLGPNFKEGQELRTKGQVTISFHDDDHYAMEMILCALHHQSNATTAIGRELLLPMALLSDKYDCSRALAPWVPHWCQVWTASIGVSEAAYTLLAAYLFRAPTFYEISRKVVVYPTSDFESCWEDLGGLSLLPEHIICNHPFPLGFSLLTNSSCVVGCGFRDIHAAS